MGKTYVTKNGRRLTEEDLERAAAEAERGFDLSTWAPRPGRPPLEAGAGEHSPRIAVRVPVSLHRRVAARAAADGHSVSQVVRSLLERYADERT